MRIPRLLFVTALLTAVLGSEAGAARYRSRVSIEEALYDYLAGDVTAKLRACEPKRLVRLYERTGPDAVELRAEDYTSGKGHWETFYPAEPGATYFAKVTRKVVSLPDGTTHTCTPAISPDYIG